MEKLRLDFRRIEEGLTPLMVVFSDDFDISAHQELETGAETVARIMLRDAIEKVRRRVHEIVSHVSDHPGINPIIRACKSSGKGDWGCFLEPGVAGIYKMILVMTV